MHRDSYRALASKKYEILGEMEAAKDRILMEMSGLDKCTLTRLREIVAMFDDTYNRIVAKVNDLSTLTATHTKYTDNKVAEMQKGIDDIASILKSIEDVRETIKEWSSADVVNNMGFVLERLDTVDETLKNLGDVLSNTENDVNTLEVALKMTSDIVNGMRGELSNFVATVNGWNVPQLEGRVYNLEAKVFPSEPSHDKCIEAYLTYANGKASEMQLTETVVKSPSGVDGTDRMSPRDLFKLGTLLAANERATRYWSARAKSISIKGDHARVITLTMSVTSAGDYPIYCGKGGSLIVSNGYYRAAFVTSKVAKNPCGLAILVTTKDHYDNMYSYIAELFAALQKKINGETYTLSEGLTALGNELKGGYMVGDHVDFGTIGYGVTPRELFLNSNYIHKETAIKCVPCSTIKIMTALCVLDVADNLFDTITIHADDITEGSGSTYYEGDVLTVESAMYAMMLESSNTCATALAAYVGKKLIMKGEA